MTTHPVCAGCDCVDGCSKVKDKACMQPQPVSQEAQVSISRDDADFAAAFLEGSRVQSTLNCAARIRTAIAPQPVIAPAQSLIAALEKEIAHSEINDLRLTPNFGKLKGELAVRVGSIEALIESHPPVAPAWVMLTGAEVRKVVSRVCSFYTIDDIAIAKEIQAALIAKQGAAK